MVGIKTTSRLWMILVYCIVVTHLCAAFPALGEAIEDATSEGDQAKLAVGENVQIRDRLSMSWHPLIRQIAYNEAFLGNSQLEEAEVSLLLSMAEISEMEGKDSQRFLEESLWKLLVSMPLNLDSSKSVFGKLIARARSHSSVLQAEIFLARYDAVTEIGDIAREVVNLAERVRSGEQVEIRNNVAKKEIPYLLCTSRPMPPRTVFEGLIRSDEQFATLFADACMLRQGVVEWSDFLVDAVVSSEDTKAHISLAYYVAHAKPANWENVLEMLKNTIPHEIVNGEKIFRMSTADSYGMLLPAMREARDVIGLTAQYKRTKVKNTLTRFISRNEENAQLSRYKSWILYRYHSELILPLLKQYGRYTRLAAYRQIQLKQVLSGALRYGRIFEGLIPSFGQVKSTVRVIAFESKEPVQRVNGLFLLEELANEDDLPSLNQAAYDKVEISWKQGNMVHSGPLLAIRALHCIKAVNSTKSRLMLEKMSQDEAVHPKVAEHALEMLQH